MINAGVLLSEIALQMNDPRGTADAPWKNTLLVKLNESYRETYSSYPFTTLTKVAELTDDVYRMPSDVYKILEVKDENKLNYNFIGGGNRLSSYAYNWYWDTPVATALNSGTTLAVTEYATAVTSDAEFPATTCVDEYIRIGSNAGIYLISAWTSTSAITLTDNFRGITESNAIYSIRPVGTPVLAFSDSTGAELTPTGIEVTYTKQPLPLWRDEDLIELPGDCTAVRIKTEQKLLRMLKRDWEARDQEKSYIAALGIMKSLEPATPIMKPNSLFTRRDMMTSSDLHDRLTFGN